MIMNNESGHSVICKWPYADCEGQCPHLQEWRSHKFATPFAERLWTLTLDSNQDAEVGEAETYGWYARFDHERAVVDVDSQGYVQATYYMSVESLERDWTELETQYVWSQLAQLTTSECDELFLILDTAEHNNVAPDVEVIKDHIRAHAQCHESNGWVLEDL